MTTHAPVGIAVVQFVPTADTDANLTAIAELVATAAERGARVVVAPEYSSYFVNPFDASLLDNAQDLDGPFALALATIAAQHDLTIVAGLVERGTGDRVRNAAVAVDGTGVIAAYRKQHLYDAFGQTESDWIEPGPLGEPETFVVDGLRFGMMTCYDLRFPEAARTLVDAGTDIILVPAEWVRGPLKEHHWETLITARAIENTVYIAAADHAPPIGVGRSMIVDPQGVPIASLGTAAGDLAIGWASHEQITGVRRVNPALDLRRYRVAPRD
ncbi:MAG: carbon-nitrogen hydrolase family protein [Microbacterium gubbeenense]|uniref:carbon-nitrogen hydrolase family protein n=4 Tax=Microbacterium gubbeenense TaxID=159896 RepID=UPI00048BB6DD|nr:carbon-nitrogen hydrolase family protein [Microbacterium gubbeenense]